MRYLVPARSARSLGAWQDTLATALQQGVQRADPDLAEVLQLTKEIITVERKPGGLLDPRTPSTFQISDLRRPLKMYLFYRRHPLVVYSIPLGIVALAFLVGRATRATTQRETR